MNYTFHVPEGDTYEIPPPLGWQESTVTAAISVALHAASMLAKFHGRPTTGNFKLEFSSYGAYLDFVASLRGHLQANRDRYPSYDVDYGGDDVMVYTQVYAAVNTSNGHTYPIGILATWESGPDNDPYIDPEPYDYDDPDPWAYDETYDPYIEDYDPRSYG